jgi:tight adherence protein B
MSELLNDPAVLMAGGAGLAVVLLLLAFLDGGSPKDRKRVDKLRQRGTPEIAAELKLRRTSTDHRTLDQIFRRLIPQPELLRQRLRRTGYNISIGSYGLACLIVALLVATGLIVFGISLAISMTAAVLAGLWLPHLAVGWLGGRRAVRFTVLFPEAIGLMVRSIKSGLPVTESFQIVSNEIPDPVGNEFRQISDQIRLGQQVDKVMWDAANRVGTPELKFLVVTLSVQRETGGNLAETLENLDNILRRRRQMRLKIRAMSSEARASAMIVGALPFLMMGLLSAINWEYISLLFTHPTGHTQLTIAGGMMMTGIFIMAKLVRFEI